MDEKEKEDCQVVWIQVSTRKKDGSWKTTLRSFGLKETKETREQRLKKEKEEKQRKTKKDDEKGGGDGSSSSSSSSSRPAM